MAKEKKKPLVDYAYIDTVFRQCIACHDSSWSCTNDEHVDMALRYRWGGRRHSVDFTTAQRWEGYNDMG